MNRFWSHILAPVRREGAERYLLYSLLSFAGSVALTRLFLELTGYPQLGNSELHVAHVLWGGLLLFIASLLPLLLSNRWVYTVGGILSGVGVGLFIDEVGKFITQTNDYFYPPAAPIIYAFFLIVVLLYQRVRRPHTHDPRAELYRAFEALQEVLDHDLDPRERKELIDRLERIVNDAEHPNHAALGRALLTFVIAEEIELAPERAPIFDRTTRAVDQATRRWVNRPLFRLALSSGFALAGLAALGELSILLPNGPAIDEVLALFLPNGDSITANQVFLYSVRLALEGIIGFLLISAALLLLLGRENRALNLAYAGLLAGLTVANLLVFYFEQFSTILTALLQLTLLGALLFYRRHYLIDTRETVAESEGRSFERSPRT